jgi:DnaK suppressor protein
MEELTPKQLEELTVSLNSAKGELELFLAELTEGAKPVEPDAAIGRITRMDAMQMQQMAQASRRKSRQRLHQVFAALQRISEETYGECAECGDYIGFPRLNARPEAPFCLDCQDRREKKSRA